MRLGATLITDESCQAFRAHYARLRVTAQDDHWLRAALDALCGYATSVIGCDAEVGVERTLAPDRSSGDRPGADVLLFGLKAKPLARAVMNRTGQCLLTCPTVEVRVATPEPHQSFTFGDWLRCFGDGFERQDEATGEWVVPVMEGEVRFEPKVGVARGLAGGVLMLQGAEQAAVLAAARRAAEALAETAGVITPFPGGVCRSGSKVGSKYRGPVASTNEAFCPTLRERVATRLVEGARCAYEIVIDGVDEPAVRGAMAVAMRAAAGDGLLAIGASDLGGRRGGVKIALRDVLR
ncbi:Formyltransferase/hydrolase complex subunit D [Pseudobythopirellula maris]|uniref:Formyltransferase/hydrolase complex subunit D n=1 Tax=Pseudobythopirellula maris TaxID=2527991 RepID=A0A5C5ZNS3_9BACT|nr:formylmethanofuran--tetrahydromethanopterin N-formyltransferase [Pseudobythopirellula maris]TWT88840.1 Formyltransferase/hydrolase complex subunit D [Pseudobythopirellula maris]